MNLVTYHHYGASLIHAPIDRLRRDMYAALDSAPDALRAAERATTILAEVTDSSLGTHLLSYRSTMGAPELAQYSVICTLASVVDAPHCTFVEWTREYRPAVPADQARIRALVRALVDQDQAIASQLATKYGSTEVFCIDYTLGGA